MQFHSHIIFRSPLNNITQNINQPVFLEALYLSTPALYEEYIKHLENPLTDTKALKKLNISLYKYQSRASNRCTPFGLFAGLGIANWATENNITLNADLKQTLQRKTRLDMNVLFSLSQELAKLPYIKTHLKYYPNTSIYLIGNSYRYVEYYYTNNRRFHKINKVDYSEYLELILQQASIGLTHYQLSNLLVNDEISLDEASGFIDEIVTSQLLVNQLEPTVTGPDYFDVLLNNIFQIHNNNENSDFKSIIDLLMEIDVLIKKTDESIFNPIESYKQIHKQLKTMLPELSETNLFQTDLYKTAKESSLDNNIQMQLKEVIEFLNKITPPLINHNLQKFRQRFQENYEGYEIPLLVALDTETGIGYPDKDINGINDLAENVFPIRNASAEREIKWNLLQVHLLKLITDSHKKAKKVIKISEADFANIDYSVNSVLPPSFTIKFNVINSTTCKIDMGNAGGPSAINLLGRFAGGNDDLKNVVTQIAEFEQLQYPGKLLAEIVHLPESRTGNILSRLVFRNYEIPYLAKSAVDNEFQIKMSDLVLKLKGDTIILFDKRLQKEIIPRLGNAHNYSFNSLPLYHFLCDLQCQYFTKPYLGFNFGTLSNQFDFLPRVEFQNVVLSPARWQLKKTDLELLQNKTISDSEKLSYFLELKRRIELPDKFLIADGDNELLIDCSNPIAVDTFIDSVKNRNEISILEYLFEDEHALIKDTDSVSFTNECIAIVLNESKVNSDIQKNKAKEFTSKQTFTLGSEWLYYKIYCGAKTADYILAEKIKSITESLLQAGIIDKWFFIRYADSDIHLRFRLHIKDFSKYSYVLQLINSELEPLMEQRLISKIQTDTYKRELERYGDNTIELIEQLFYLDSVFVSEMLSMLDSETGNTIRWQIAIRAVDELLNDFKYNTNDKFRLIEHLSTSFFNEHGGKKELKIVLDNKFRALRVRVEDILSKSNETEKEYYTIIEALQQRSVSGRDVINKLLELNKNQELQLPLNDLLASVLHMNLDRLFMGRNRTNEFVVYDLLFRHYKSTLARAKSNAKKEVGVMK